MDKLYSAGDVVFMMSYEAHFHYAGYVNKHNRRYWAQQKPQTVKPEAVSQCQSFSLVWDIKKVNCWFILL